MKRFSWLVLVFAFWTVFDFGAAEAATNPRVLKARCRKTMAACRARGKSKKTCQKRQPRQCRQSAKPSVPGATPTPTPASRTSSALDGSAGGPYSGIVGNDITLEGSASGGSGGYHFSWDLDNNGSFETAGRRASFQKSAAGDYSVRLHITDDGGHEITRTGKVVLSKNVAASVPPIPSLAQWESQMISFGKRNCARMTDPSITDEKKLSDTYYDAQWVFYQIADYTHDNYWNTCAESASAIYRDYYSIPNAGRLPGYWNFTHGLTWDYLRSGDVTSKNAAIQISREAGYAYDGTSLNQTVDAALSREVSYAIMGFLNAETLGQPRRSRLAPMVDQALGHIDQWVISRTAPYVRPFMVALTAHALMSWHEVSGDARVLPALKAAADYIWSKCWMASAEAFQYTDRSIGNSDDLLPSPDLNLLVAPMYAWLYHQTGDVTYRDQGDAIFAGGVKSAYLIGGKQFNQSYRLSFEFVRLRSLPPLR